MTNYTELPILAQVPEGYAELPAHERDEFGICLHCGDDLHAGFETYSAYLYNWWTEEFEGDPNHSPMEPEEWEYIHTSCLGPCFLN